MVKEILYIGCTHQNICIGYFWFSWRLIICKIRRSTRQQLTFTNHIRFEIFQYASCSDFVCRIFCRQTYGQQFIFSFQLIVHCTIPLTQPLSIFFSYEQTFWRQYQRVIVHATNVQWGCDLNLFSHIHFPTICLYFFQRNTRNSVCKRNRQYT